MATIHNLGFPRIGRQRELKFALEDFWRGDLSESELTAVGESIRALNWAQQSKLDLVPVGDFSFYDQVLDTSFLLGNIPERAVDTRGSELDRYFRVARGRTADDTESDSIAAAEMTKWFDTNYHYIVPEVTSSTRFELNNQYLLRQIQDIEFLGLNGKPVLIGPVTYLWLGKPKDGSNILDLLDRLIPVYRQLLDALDVAGVDWVQIDEPILVTELEREWQQAIKQTYRELKHPRLKLLLATYFGTLKENLSFTCQLPVDGLHIDAIRGREEVEEVIKQLPEDRVLSLGVVDGRNIWKNDLEATLNWLHPLASQLGERLWLAPSCSLLHVPVDLEIENQLDEGIKSWLAFACQKLEELKVLGKGINQGRKVVSEELEANRLAIESRRKSTRVNNPDVQRALNAIDDRMGQRQSRYSQRVTSQAQRLDLPPFPTTTIGSFPQTAEIRKARMAMRKNQLDADHYTALMQQEIIRAVREQEKLGLDILVHGEAERNDMVEYFGEQLEGYAFTRFGWVQSYGSRCVKPPVLYGDISRPRPITVDWARFASSQTDKPMKGMLTGPVTILNWSFVRDDQPRRITCQQLALAVREEVLDLEKAGIHIIQIDEAALREGLPLRRSEWQHYLDWAVASYRIAANGVRDETQIHTHMCYSEFNDIIEAIADMDADVITIETSRSGMELLDVFERFEYPNEIGPGVYDIHSPNIPSVKHMVELMKKAAERIPAERLWVNPDCGLKTRQWDEVIPALRNMVEASRQLRELPLAQGTV